MLLSNRHIYTQLKENGKKKEKKITTRNEKIQKKEIKSSFLLTRVAVQTEVKKLILRTEVP